MFSRMCDAVSSLVNQILEHPFNQQLHQGTLSNQTFDDFLRQDILYLHDFSNALLITSKKFTNSAYSNQFSLLSRDAKNEAHNIHEKYLGKNNPNGFFHAEMDTEKNPVISAYTSHLLENANLSS